MIGQRVKTNLGNAYGDRIRGEEADNLEMAIAAYQASLEVRTREAFPFDWAKNQNNLGNAYSKRIRGEKAENLEMAIAASQASLSVYTREAFPIDNARKLHLISDLPIEIITNSQKLTIPLNRH